MLKILYIHYFYTTGIILMCITCATLLTSCSLFHDDEEIKVHNPKPGTRLVIDEEALPVVK